MDCVNHSGVNATAYCQNCGKALCAGCVRNAAGGQVLCEPCLRHGRAINSRLLPSLRSGPNPSAAAVLGLIPGVGAMYNGQFFKGFIHVVIFAVLITITDHYRIFGIFIAAWILYQSFEAFHTAKALRDGQPLPDPLGLNEVGNWLNLGGAPQYPPQPGQPGTARAGGSARPCNLGSGLGSALRRLLTRPPYHGLRTTAAAIRPPIPPASPIPPVPPSAPLCWRRKEPIGAIVLIALGLLFLLASWISSTAALWSLPGRWS